MSFPTTNPMEGPTQNRADHTNIHPLLHGESQKLTGWDYVGVAQHSLYLEGEIKASSI